MAKKCSLEGITTEINNIKFILIGNGTKGLVRKMDETKTSLIKLEADAKLKMWIYRAVIAALIATTTFLATQKFS